jgi:hypothetical protein
LTGSPDTVPYQNGDSKFSGVFAFAPRQSRSECHGATLYSRHHEKAGTTEKQTSYDVVSKILIIDDVDDADDTWMMFEGSANKIAAGQGQWFRSSSYNKVILTGDIGNRMIRNELVINYLSWPMQRGQIGTCTAAKPIRVTDDSKEYYYHVDKVQ